MLKQKSLRRAVLIRAEVHWPNTFQSCQLPLSKGKLVCCAGLLLPGSQECRPPLAGTGIPWSLQAHGLLPRTQGMCFSSAGALQSCRCVHFWPRFLGGPGTRTGQLLYGPLKLGHSFLGITPGIIKHNYSV